MAHQRRSDFPSLAADLLTWAASRHHPAIQAIAANDSDGYFSRCLARLFRERAAEDYRWLFAVCLARPAEVLGISPLIRNVVAAGFQFPPEGWTWERWLREQAFAEGFADPDPTALPPHFWDEPVKPKAHAMPTPQLAEAVLF
jgi:hypothetical protein